MKCQNLGLGNTGQGLDFLWAFQAQAFELKPEPVPALTNRAIVNLIPADRWNSFPRSWQGFTFVGFCAVSCTSLLLDLYNAKIFAISITANALKIKCACPHLVDLAWLQDWDWLNNGRESSLGLRHSHLSINYLEWLQWFQQLVTQCLEDPQYSGRVGLQ